MSYQKLYSPKVKKIFRIMALVAIIILVASEILAVTTKGFSGIREDKYQFISCIENLIIICILTVFAFYPEKIGILSIIAFYYSVRIELVEPENMMGLFMYFLTISSLYARGHFNRNRKTKNIAAVVVFLALLLTQIRFGSEIFFTSLVCHIGYGFVFACCVFFIRAYLFDLFEEESDKKKLNIQKYSELKKRDADWLVKIQKGEKYESIAIDEKMSVGSVKNRFKIIFDELGVGDRRGFFNKYSDYEIFYIAE